jgi:anhydro-N-acetylmuramic acid kinase
MDRLDRLRERLDRTVAGVMTGTSLDGVDVAIARLEGSGASLDMTLEATAEVPYPEPLRAMLLRNSTPDTSSVDDLARLNVRLCSLYAEGVDRALEAAGLGRDALDLVGSHGQTVRHLPEPADCAGEAVRATLQIGSPSTLAQRLETVVVGDFRMADLARGGQGAPLVPYFDYVRFADPDQTRLLLNLGGIANVTVLPAGADADRVRAFDTGPANMVIDGLAERLFDRSYDPDGRHAAAGTPDHDLLVRLLKDEYFRHPPPKSTGRERFGTPFVDEVLNRAEGRGLSPEDTMATATLLTAASVYQAYARYVREETPVDVVVASGGGVHNETLMRMLGEAFDPIPVRTAADLGLDTDAKEALCFAVLAHETVNGVPTNLPSATGADRPALLGSISVPR